jgi:4-hydroxy-4-methyl-2-oxoglutarate aldolase
MSVQRSSPCRVWGPSGCRDNGFVRDVRAIRNTGFSVFHGGIAPLDSKGRGKVADIDVPIVCAGVRVEPGDLVFGDADGVVAVPRKVEEAVLARSFETVRGENVTRDERRDVFDRFGVL